MEYHFSELSFEQKKQPFALDKQLQLKWLRGETLDVLLLFMLWYKYLNETTYPNYSGPYT